MTFVKPNKTGKSNQSDLVMTNLNLAKWIVNYFKPRGTILEPCRGTGNFYVNFPKECRKKWYEITDGRDFFDCSGQFDWIITNPPYSIYDKFLLKCFQVADNIILLVPLGKTFKSQKIDRKIEKYGGLKEIVLLGGGGCVGFTFGFPVGCLYYKRNYNGDIKLTRCYDWKNNSHNEI